MVAALPSFITVPEAARRLGLPENRIRTLVEAGKMKAVEINGEIAVSEESVEKRELTPSTTRKEDLPEYKKFADLSGKSIWLSEAARKYNISLTTLSGWVKSGLITRIGTEKNRVLLSEQDIAYCAEIYQRNAGQGKWIFNKDGTPYIPKNH